MRHSFRGTNSWFRRTPSLEKQKCNTHRLVVDESHFQPLGSWSSKKINESRASVPFMQTWAPGNNRHGIPNITHGEGVYLYDDKGNRYLDWTSQAVCANLGHTLPHDVAKSGFEQMTKSPFLYSGMGIPEVRVRMNQLMAEILPGNLVAAIFPSSGAEANEAGITMARRYTGRHKIISWYRSYHGGTGNAQAATGDYRRWYGKDYSSGGMVKAFNPFPLFFDHAAGVDGPCTEERVRQALLMLEEQILNEGPDDIASIMMESIVGAGGCLVMPDGYMQGIRAICDNYGILMHCDEVMVGFGRTGTLFGFQNYEGVLPDIVSCAKGISGAAVPLSMTACTTEIMEFFEDKPLGYGSTYQAHPVALACAYESVKYLLKENVLAHVNYLAPLFEEEMYKLACKHPCIKQYRAIGLFGCFDVHNTDGSNPKLQHEAGDYAFQCYKQAFFKNGLMGLHRYPHIHCAPPLIISENELLDGFQRLDNTLYTLDEALGFLDMNNMNDEPMAASS